MHRITLTASYIAIAINCQDIVPVVCSLVCCFLSCYLVVKSLWSFVSSIKYASKITKVISYYTCSVFIGLLLHFVFLSRQIALVPRIISCMQQCTAMYIRQNEIITKPFSCCFLLHLSVKSLEHKQSEMSDSETQMYLKPESFSIGSENGLIPKTTS